MKRVAAFQLLPSRLEGVEAVSAESSIAFGRHVHDQYGIGLMERGGHRSASGRGTVEAWPGDLVTVNPGEVHDGAPIGSESRSWRMLYLDPSLVSQAAGDIVSVTRWAGEFREPVLRDPWLAGRLRGLFDMVTGGPVSPMRFDETLLGLLAPVVGPGDAEAPGIPSAVRRVRSALDDDPAAAVSLAELARLAGLGRYHLLRAFTRLTGLTPHAYLVQRRLQLARTLIRRGLALAEVAAACGFADQSHLTRAFARAFGYTPGAYARARS